MLGISVICLCFLQLFGGGDCFTGNLSCKDVYGHGYYYYYYYYDEPNFGEDNKLVQYYVNKILNDETDDQSIKSLEKIFTDDVEQEIEITYRLTVPCNNKKNVIKTKFVYTEQQAFPGILKGMEGKNQKETIKIEMTAAEGFDQECEELFCDNENEEYSNYYYSRRLSKKDLQTIFCQVTNQLVVSWLDVDNYQGASVVGQWNCFYDDYASVQIWQYVLFEIAMGLFHLIAFILLVKYRFKFHDYIGRQTQGNQARSLLFWSFIVSIILLFVYIVIIGLLAVTNRQVGRKEAYTSQQSDNILFDVFSIFMSTTYLVFFALLHFPVVYCCMCSCNDERSSTSLCIPGTCFSKYAVCSCPFRSLAFYVINIIPHIVLFLVSLLGLRFSSAPIPSVTVLFYFALLLFADVIFNALSINLITSMCKNEKCCSRCCCRCCYCFFGFIVAIATNIMTVIVVISLIDYLLNTTEQSSYSAILPGVIITVCGWYFSGDITKYTGIDFSLEGSSNMKKNDEIVDIENGNTAYNVRKDEMELKKKH